MVYFNLKNKFTQQFYAHLLKWTRIHEDYKSGFYTPVCLLSRPKQERQEEAIPGRKNTLETRKWSFDCIE